MFNYLFPIFCFGLVISGIVFLGVLEAAKQAKAHDLTEREPANSSPQPRLVPSRSGHQVAITAPRNHD